MLKNKANNKKGFTLAELLIVVAIIGILVAISFPIFTSQLEKSRLATDQANEKAAKSAAAVLVLDEKTESGIFYYNPVTGKLVKDKKSDIVGYGKSKNCKDKIVKVTIDSDTKEIKTSWDTAETTATTPSGTDSVLP